MKKSLGQWIAVFFLCGLARAVEPVPVDFFYEPGCRSCERIRIEVLPQVDEQFGDSCEILWHDVGVESNFLALLDLEYALGYMDEERGYLVVAKQTMFGPTFDVDEFLSAISNAVGQAATTEPIAESSGIDAAKKRFSTYTFAAVCAIGLSDGINPCAISTLVFFMSLLAVSKVRSRQLIALGVSYCLASFLTYLAIGFGLLRVLHVFSGYTTMRSVLEWGMIVILLVLAFLSFRDAFRFRKSQDARDVTLQLPLGIKKRIHSVMRRGLKTGHLLLGGFAIGAAVTALEVACTGQSYVPTLVLILKNVESDASRAWAYLITYNLLFILPLVAVFTAVTFGLRTETLLDWSKKNVTLSKTLLGLLFIVMAVLIAQL